MHRICTKYAKNICSNMQIYAIYMQKYANICSTVCATEICKNMQKYAKYMHAICKNMQNMQSRFLYAEYAKICTPHFADDSKPALLCQVAANPIMSVLCLTMKLRCRLQFSKIIHRDITSRVVFRVRSVSCLVLVSRRRVHHD